MDASTSPRSDTTSLGVLGPTVLSRSGAQLGLGTPRERSIIAALALGHGRPVRFDQVVERVWGETAPRTAKSTMQRYVASLRQLVEPDREAHSTIVTAFDGYALAVAEGRRDDVEFVALVEQAQRITPATVDLLVPRARPEDRERLERALVLLDDAESLWRGRAYDDLGEDCAPASAERERLDTLRLEGRRIWFAIQLALGRHSSVTGQVASICAAHPFDESWAALHAVSLVRSGRQAEALQVLTHLRRTLAEDLGIDPMPQVQNLYLAILAQDTELVAGSPSGSASVPIRCTSRRQVGLSIRRLPNCAPRRTTPQRGWSPSPR